MPLIDILSVKVVFVDRSMIDFCLCERGYEIYVNMNILEKHFVRRDFIKATKYEKILSESELSHKITNIIGNAFADLLDYDDDNGITLSKEFLNSDLLKLEINPDQKASANRGKDGKHRKNAAKSS